MIVPCHHRLLDEAEAGAEVADRERFDHGGGEVEHQLPVSEPDTPARIDHEHDVGLRTLGAVNWDRIDTRDQSMKTKIYTRRLFARITVICESYRQSSISFQVYPPMYEYMMRTHIKYPSCSVASFGCVLRCRPSLAPTGHVRRYSLLTSHTVGMTSCIVSWLDDSSLISLRVWSSLVILSPLCFVICKITLPYVFRYAIPVYVWGKWVWIDGYSSVLRIIRKPVC